GNLVRSLFVPKQKTLRNFTDNIPAIMQTKIPFAYFYEVENRLTNINATTEEITIAIPIRFQNVNTSLQILSSENTATSNIADTLRPILEWVIWISVLLYFYFAVIHLQP